MIVEAPDGKTIDFGDLPQEQVQSAMSKMYPVNSSKEEPTFSDKISTAMRQGAQGVTSGFADEIKSGASALAASGLNKLSSNPVDTTMGQFYNQAMQDESAARKKDWEQSPVISGASNLLGGILTGQAIGSRIAQSAPKAASFLANSSSKAAQVAKGAGLGAVQGAVAGAGTADTQNGETRSGQAAIGGLIGGATGGLLSSITGKSVIGEKTSKDVAKESGKKYAEAEAKGGILTPEFTNKFIEEAKSVTPQTEAGRLVSGDNPVTKIIERMQGLKDRPMTLNEAQEIDEFLGDAIDNFTDAGRLTKQGKKLLEVQTSFRNMINDADENMIAGGKEGFSALKDARALWSKSAKLRDIEKIITRAETSENTASAIKNGFRNLYNNQSRMRGYSKEEAELIRKAAESGVISDTLKALTNRMIPAAALVGGGGLTGAATAHAMSIAAKNASSKAQLGKAAKVANKIVGAKTNYPTLFGLGSK